MLCPRGWTYPGIKMKSGWNFPAKRLFFVLVGEMTFVLNQTNRQLVRSCRVQRICFIVCVLLANRGIQTVIIVNIFVIKIIVIHSCFLYWSIRFETCFEDFLLKVLFFLVVLPLGNSGK